MNSLPAKNIFISIIITLIAFYPLSFLNVLAIDRHSIELGKAASTIVYGSEILKQWIRNVNATLTNTSEVDAALAKKLLQMVYNDTRLALFIGAAQLRALKMFSGEGFYITREDISKLLILFAEKSLENDLGCDKPLSKLILNLYNGYEFCSYNYTDIANLIDYVIETGKGVSANTTARISSKLLLILMLYKGAVSMSRKTFDDLLNDMLVYDSIVLAMFIKNFVSYHPINFDYRISYSNIQYITKSNETSNVIDVNTFEKAIYKLIELIESEKISIKTSEFISMIFLGISTNIGQTLQVLLSNNISISSIEVIASPNQYIVESSKGASSIPNQFFRNGSSPYMISPSQQLMESYMGMGNNGIAEESYISRSRVDSGATSSSVRKSRILSLNFKDYKALEEVVAKSNAISFAETILESNRLSSQSIKDVVIVDSGAKKQFQYGNQMFILFVSTSTLLTFIVFVVIVFSKHNILLAMKKLFVVNRARVFADTKSALGKEDEKTILLHRFWKVLHFVSGKHGVTINNSDTHRDVLSKLVKANPRNIQLIKTAVTKYEVLRYSNMWSGKDLKELSNFLNLLEKDYGLG